MTDRRNARAIKRDLRSQVRAQHWAMGRAKQALNNADRLHWVQRALFHRRAARVERAALLAAGPRAMFAATTEEGT